MSDKLTTPQYLTLNPEQQVVIRRIGTVCSIGYNYQVSAINAIANSIVDILSRGEKVMIISGEENIRASLKKLLVSSGLKNSLADLNPSHKFSEEAGHLIRNKAATIESQKEDLKVLLNRHIWHRKELSFRSSISLSAKSVFGGFSLRDIIYMHAHKASDPDCTYLSHHCKELSFDFTEEEYTALRSAIIKALKFQSVEYSPEAKVISKHDLLNKIKDDNKYNVLLNKLLQYKNEASELRNNYYTLIQKLENDKYNTLLHLYFECKEKTDNLQFISDYSSPHTLNANQKSSGITNFFKSTNTPPDQKSILINTTLVEINDLLSSLSIKAEMPAVLNIEGINVFCSNVHAKLEEAFKNFKIQAQLFVRSLNTLNSGEPSALHIESELEQLVEKLNNSGVFLENLEINTISILKQSEKSGLIADILKSGISELKFEKSRKDWLLFYQQSMHSFKIVYKYLQHLDTDKWLSAFEAWYFHEMIKSYVSESDSKLINDKDEYISGFNTYVMQSLELNNSGCLRQLDAAIEALKLKDKQLYADLIKKKKVPDVTWKYILEKHCDLVSPAFPVLIVENDDFKDIPSGNYEHIIYIGYSNYNPEILQNFKTIHTYLDSEQMNTTSSDILLELQYPQDFSPISEQRLSERLATARALSGLLLSTQPRVRFFQTRNLNIISYLNSYVQKLVLQYLKQSGIKEILPSGNVNDQMVESLLETDRRPYLFVEDDLFDTANTDNLCWQYQLLQEMKKAGFTIISFNSFEAIEHGSSYLEKTLTKGGIDLPPSNTQHFKMQLAENDFA